MAFALAVSYAKHNHHCQATGPMLACIPSHHSVTGVASGRGGWVGKGAEGDCMDKMPYLFRTIYVRNSKWEHLSKKKGQTIFGRPALMERKKERNERERRISNCENRHFGHGMAGGARSTTGCACVVRKCFVNVMCFGNRTNNHVSPLPCMMLLMYVFNVLCYL